MRLIIGSGVKALDLGQPHLKCVLIGTSEPFRYTVNVTGHHLHVFAERDLNRPVYHEPRVKLHVWILFCASSSMIVFKI